MKKSEIRVIKHVLLLLVMLASNLFSVDAGNHDSQKSKYFSFNICLIVKMKNMYNSCLVEGPVVGIDLGTTYSWVGIFKNGRVEIIPNELGNRTTPSFVAFTDKERLVGEAAKNQAALNPERSVYAVKRLIGRNFKDKEIQRDKELVSYNIVDKNGKPYVLTQVKGVELKVLSPEEISAMVLTKMKQIAENYLGQEV